MSGCYQAVAALELGWESPMPLPLRLVDVLRMLKARSPSPLVCGSASAGNPPAEPQLRMHMYPACFPARLSSCHCRVGRPDSQQGWVHCRRAG